MSKSNTRKYRIPSRAKIRDSHRWWLWDSGDGSLAVFSGFVQTRVDDEVGGAIESYRDSDIDVHSYIRRSRVSIVQKLTKCKSGSN